MQPVFTMTCKHSASVYYQLYVGKVGENQDYPRVAGGKNTLTFKRPTFSNENACKKTYLENHFIYLGNKVIYFIFKTCCKFSTKCNFITLSFSTQIILMFFISHALKFKYPPQFDKG